MLVSMRRADASTRPCSAEQPPPFCAASPPLSAEQRPLLRSRPALPSLLGQFEAKCCGGPVRYCLFTNSNWTCCAQLQSTSSGNEREHTPCSDVSSTALRAQQMCGVDADSMLPGYQPHQPSAGYLAAAANARLAVRHASCALCRTMQGSSLGQADVIARSGTPPCPPLPAATWPQSAEGSLPLFGGEGGGEAAEQLPGVCAASLP
eukprot:357723-Chlamydomonas_euryale.AAC.10